MWAFLNPNVPENCAIDSSAIQILYEKHCLASGTAKKAVFVEENMIEVCFETLKKEILIELMDI